MKWNLFDYQNKAATAPPSGDPVWVIEEFYNEGDVVIGYYDGYTMRVWSGSDDCFVSHWAEIEYPKGIE